MQLSKIKKLNLNLHFLIVTEIYFIEPDLHFTIIDFNQELLCIYIDFDSGLRHSNMAKESGISLRINVAKSDFTKFINELASLH